MRFSVRGEGQIRKSLGTSDETEAHRIAMKLWHEAQYRKEHGLRAVQRRFRAVAEEFCDHMDRLARDGEVRHDRADRTRPLVERYFAPFFGKKPIDAITDADVTRYIAWREATGRPALAKIRPTSNMCAPANACGGRPRKCVVSQA